MNSWGTFQRRKGTLYVYEGGIEKGGGNELILLRENLGPQWAI